jgi:hypothetical protein
MRVVFENRSTPDPKLVRNLVKAFEWREALERGEYKSLSLLDVRDLKSIWN